ncbi:MAG: ABC transporter substrate-binding protein [Gaiellaceae bacterium]
MRSPVSVGVVAAGAVLLALAACSGAEDDTQARRVAPLERGGTIRVVLAGDTDSVDPAVAYTQISWQHGYATCLKLLNYPDRPAPEGWQLRPEAAAAMPYVTGGGRTYTFTIRWGLRFSPPSGKPVRAQSFARAIERALDPRLRSAGARYVLDIVGAHDYRAGRARKIAGLRVVTNRLLIHLRRPVPDFLHRLAMPFFCAVPEHTPARESRVPSAGPYYVTERKPGRSLVLERNPNYRGKRPQTPARIVYRVGVPPARGLSEVESGEADYAGDALPDAAHERLWDEWGPESASAGDGRQRYFVHPLLSLFYFRLNATRGLFRDADARRAVNLAVDRTALANAHGPFAGEPTDQLLPPAAPAFEDADIYPLDRPDVEHARELLSGRPATLRLYTCDSDTCATTARTLTQNLAALSVRVRTRAFEREALRRRAETPGEPWDLLWSGWAADSPHAAMLEGLLDRTLPPVAGRDYARADAALSRDAAPIVPYLAAAARDFFSARTGCQLFQPLYGMNLAALCLES